VLSANVQRANICKRLHCSAQHGHPSLQTHGTVNSSIPLAHSHEHARCHTHCHTHTRTHPQANYVPSYSRNPVQTWRDYDGATVLRELGYAQALGLNAVRVFLHMCVQLTHSYALPLLIIALHLCALWSTHMHSHC
jgi:hypothetical protein